MSIHSRLKIIKEFEKRYPDKTDLHNRLRGTTTALAFKYISEAMLTPGMQIKIKDHYRTRQANLQLANLILYYIDHLGLNGFKLIKSNCTLTYSLDW